MLLLIWCTTLRRVPVYYTKQRVNFHPCQTAIPTHATVTSVMQGWFRIFVIMIVLSDEKE